MRRTKLFAALLAISTLLAGCREEILHDLDEVRANEASLVLERAGIQVKKLRSGSLWTISVEQNRALDALSTIEQSRVLSRDLNRYKESAKGFLQTREDRVRSAERELAWGLENTLERIPHVLEAKVHLRLADVPEFTGKESGSVTSAGILLVVDKESPEYVGEVQRLVGSAAGLEAGKISVLVTAGDDESEENSPKGEKSALSHVRSEYQIALGAVFLLCAAALLISRARRLKKERARPIPEPLRPIQLPVDLGLQ